MITRTLIITPEIEYNNKEVQGIRQCLNPSCVYTIFKREKGGLSVRCPIEDSVGTVMHNIGEAYINAAEGKMQ